MRLTVVSAHLPPNFVSGGTIIPLRLATGLAALGHDVRIFAGWLGEAREPLEEWSEVVEGVPVDWICITPFTSRLDPANTVNPPVTAAFERHLDRHRPEAVHLHALQTLGAPLVSAAAASGAGVVVTLHDFWWTCAEQFLVDREGRPCPLVPDCGVCPCHLTATARRERAAALAPHLAAADLVAVPSAPMASIVAAGGVDPDRLVVHPNGIPDADRLRAVERGARTGPGPSGPCVIRYVGGPEPVKGAGLVRRLAEELAGSPRARLVVHGGAEWAALATAGLVVVEPAFPAGGLPDVLAATDVVVVPSLARESFSLIVREAMLAGCAVVTSDSPGAAAAVVDGLDGLVVPTGDAEAFVDAVRRLVDEPALRERLAAAARSVEVVSVEDHVGRTEAALAEAADRATGRAADRLRDESTPIRRVRGESASIRRSSFPQLGTVLYIVGIGGAPLRYRAQLPAEALGLLGIPTEVRQYRDPEVPALARRAGIVVFYRVPATVQILELIDELRASHVPTVFDVDDLIVDPDLLDRVPALQALEPEQRALYEQGVRRYRTTLEACDAYTGTTPALTAAVGALTGMPTFELPNSVGLELARRADAARRRSRRPGPLRIGYLSGTTTHDGDWRHVEPAVVEVLRRHPGAHLVLGGHLRPGDAVARLGDRVERLPFLPWYELPEVLRDLDVNLAPLEPGVVFNEAKSAIKWLEAALCGTPTVATPTQPFRAVIDHGVDGMLADTHDEWVEALDRLLTDVALRSAAGRRAADRAVVQFSPHLAARATARALAAVAAMDRAASRAARRGRDAWVPVALDEPWEAGPVGLDPYPPTAEPVLEPVAPADPAPPGWQPRTILGRAWWSLTREGVGPSARRVVRRSRQGARIVREAVRRRVGGRTR